MATVVEREFDEDTGIKIISADNHILEPRDLFTSRFPAHLKDKAPRLMKGPDGGDGWSFNGVPPRRTYGLECMAGHDRANYKMSGLSYEDLRPGMTNGEEHLKDMDIDGLTASVCYPNASMALYTHPDLEVALAGFRAYNDFALDEFQAADPRRICALALVPTEHGIDIAVEELKRLVSKGIRAAMIPGNPTIPYNHPTHYEPLWQMANDNNVTLCFHRNHGGPTDATDWDRLDGDKVSIGGIVSRYFTAIRPFSYLIFGGTFDRYPDLKLVAAEVDCGWAPFWMQTMVHHWEIQKSWFPVKLKRSPEEFVGCNLFTTNVDDYVGYDLIKTGLYPLLADMTMFSSDYPHSATLWPNSRIVAAKMTKGMRAEDRVKVLNGNAARVFGFDI